MQRSSQATSDYKNLTGFEPLGAQRGVRTQSCAPPPIPRKRGGVGLRKIPFCLRFLWWPGQGSKLYFWVWRPAVPIDWFYIGFYKFSKGFHVEYMHASWHPCKELTLQLTFFSGRLTWALTFLHLTIIINRRYIFVITTGGFWNASYMLVFMLHR